MGGPDQHKQIDNSSVRMSGNAILDAHNDLSGVAWISLDPPLTQVSCTQ